MKYIARMMAVALSLTAGTAFAASPGTLTAACCALGACCGLPCCG